MQRRRPLRIVEIGWNRNHGVGDRFFRFWNENGGIDLFGYPIGDEVQETLPDGQTVHERLDTALAGREVVGDDQRPAHGGKPGIRAPAIALFLWCSP